MREKKAKEDLEKQFTEEQKHKSKGNYEVQKCHKLFKKKHPNFSRDSLKLTEPLVWRLLQQCFLDFFI